MAAKPLGGVAGVLGGLISDSPSPSSDPTSVVSHSTPSKKDSPETVPKSMLPKIPSRLGRPPGRKAGVHSPKEKITVRIDSTLIAAYRDWSWEARCQVGELMEGALRHYLVRRRNP